MSHNLNYTHATHSPSEACIPDAFMMSTPSLTPSQQHTQPDEHICTESRPSTTKKAYRKPSPDSPNFTLRASYVDMITNSLRTEHTESGHFITLTFKYETSAEKRLDAVNFLFHTLNQKLFGRNYVKHGKHLSGYAFHESRFSAKKFIAKHHHIHILLHDHTQPTDAPTEAPTEAPTLINRFKECITKPKTNRGWEIFNETCCDIEKITDIEPLVWYVTKTFERTKDASFIQFINSTGVTV